MSYFINQKDGVVIYEKLKTNSKNETSKEDVVRTDSSLSIEFFNQSVNSLVGFEADSEPTNMFKIPEKALDQPIFEFNTSQKYKD